MKFKILSICSVIALIYGDAFCVSVKDAVRQYESNIQNQKKGTSVKTKYLKDRRMSEVKGHTKDVRVKDRIKQFEDMDKDDDSVSYKRPRKVTVDKVATDEADSETQDRPITEKEPEENFSEKYSKTPLVTDDSEKESVLENEKDLEITHEDAPAYTKKNFTQSETFSADFRKLSANLEARFEKSQQIIDKLEQKRSDFAESLEGSENFDTKKNNAKSLEKEMQCWEGKISEQIDDLTQIQQDFKELMISEKIEQLEQYRTKIENMRADVTRKIIRLQTQQRKLEKQQKKAQKELEAQNMASIDWQAIETYNATLSIFAKAVQNHKLRFTTVQKYGKQCFEDKNGRALFDPSQKIDPSLKGLCKQVYEVRFPEAIKVWSEIKEMTEKSDKYAATLEQLRSRVSALSKNISSLIKQHNKIKNSAQTSEKN